MEGDKVFVISGAYKDRERAREVLEVLPDKFGSRWIAGLAKESPPLEEVNTPCQSS